MLTVKTLDERIAAVLHDTVEDTAITFEDLVDAGFSNVIVDAVQALTKTAGENRMDAAKRAVQNSIARPVHYLMELGVLRRCCVWSEC